jgi:hypothetical protein
MNAFSKSFPSAAWQSPPAHCLPALLWSWNGAMSRARIKESLEGFAERRIGGVYIHPRPGLVTEYLSDEWFDLWGFALAECERLGLDCHIYDENSFPSGFAGGHVASADPLSANSRLAARLVHPGEKSGSRGTRLACLVSEPDGSVRQADAPPQDSPFLSLDLENAAPRLWNAGFPMVDVCRPDVTARFLVLTHDRYAERFGSKMGKAIRHVFTDEPETGTCAVGFHLSRTFLREFRTEHGYPLEDRLDALCGETPQSPAVRHDYNLTLNRLFTTNFSKACHDWCEEHGLVFTGHFNEHAWPVPSGSPSTMAAQRWMHAPGLDLLGFQFRPGPLREAALWLFNVLEAASIARQCGRDETLCESSGGGGYEYGPAQMKPLEDFLLALGVNRLAPHLSHQTLAGSRQFDWPQTTGDHAPWWDAFGAHATHIGRVNALLDSGRTSSRVLVLNPTTTGWIRHRPDAYFLPGETRASRLESLRKSYTEFLVELYSNQIDFELGDECVMAELASVAGARLHVGACAYETVVVPAGMENLLSSTVRLLRSFLAAGGRIILCGAPPSFVDGRPARADLACPHADKAPAETLRDLHPPHLASPDGSPLPPDLLWAFRKTHDGSAVVFLANPSTGPIRADVALRGASILLCDTATGSVEEVEYAVFSGGRVSRRIDLAPGSHELWWVTDSPMAECTSLPCWQQISVHFAGCESAEPNVLLLDYCNYEGPGGVSRDGISTIAADSANWQAQGFAQNLWQSTIQFRRTFLEATVADNSAFAVRYQFQIERDFTPSGLQAGIERPWLYEVFCNGQRLSQVNATRWFDEDIRLLSLDGAVQSGENFLELRASKFHVLAEIKPVFIRGAFSLVPTDPGFLIVPPVALEDAADRVAAGRMFDLGQAFYRYQFDLPERSRLRVRLPDFLGSALGVRIDGGPPVWGFYPNGEMILADPLAAGLHELGLVLCGNLRNLLGPHFSDGLPGAWSWAQSPVFAPPGSSYRFFPTSPGGAPALEACPC